MRTLACEAGDTAFSRVRTISASAWLNCASVTTTSGDAKETSPPSPHFKVRSGPSDSTVGAAAAAARLVERHASSVATKATRYAGMVVLLQVAVTPA